MSFAIAWIASIVSMLLIGKLDVVRFAANAVEVSRRTSAVLLDKETGEDAKETAARTGAVEIAQNAIQLWVRLLFALGIAALLPLCAIWLGWADAQSLSHAFWSWQTLVVGVLALLSTFYGRL